MADIICPFIKTADVAAVEASPIPVDVADSSGTVDDNSIQIGNTKISGIRTYSIILLIMVSFIYLCLKSGSIDPLTELAYMACGFLFGVKTTRR